MTARFAGRWAAPAALVVALATLVYEWYIARVALDTPGSTAVFVILVDLVLGVFISRIAAGLY